MAKLYNLARVVTATVGTGAITLGAAVQGFLTFAQAGVATGEVVAYVIRDGANREMGKGTYTSATQTLTRTVRNSTNSNNAISLSGDAEVAISPSWEDLQSEITLRSGAVVNWNDGDVLETHSTNQLSWTGATNYQFDSKVTNSAFAAAAARVQVALHDPTIQGTVGSSSGNVGGFKWGMVYQPVFWDNVGLGGEDYIDDVWRVGSNIGTTGSYSRIDDTKASFGTTIESKFFQSSVYAHELHFEGYDTTNTLRRPFSLFVDHAGVVIDASFKTRRIDFADVAGTQRVLLDAANSTLDLNNSTVLRGGTNNVALIQQRNAAASAFINILKVDAGDVVNIAAPLYVVAARAGAAATFPGSFATFQPTSASADDEILNLVAPTVSVNLYASAATGGVTGVFSHLLRNDANSASAHAVMQLEISEVAAGDPAYRLVVSGATTWGLGLDNSDSDTFKIDASATVGGATRFSLTTAGNATIAGSVTPTGGVAAAGGFTTAARNLHTGGIPAQVSGDGTDATPVNTEVYIAEVFVPANVTLTGVSNFNGSVASGNLKVGLANSSGAVVATSASTAMVGTDVYQRVPFTGSYGAVGPATYYVLLFVDNSTARVNSHTFGDFGASKQTGQVYATGFTTITPPTTFTTALGPIASLY